jgi:myo-inositol 2-dehydrogenase / D-chiro-inositol 1-dehydrogenase
MRVAVVGCGRMGRERAKAAKSLGVEALLLFDEDPSRAKLLAAECGAAEVKEGVADLLAAELDGIFICTPPFCRGPLEVRAIELGIPFFVEKPVGVSAEQVLTVVERLRKFQLLNAVGYMNRYRNSVEHVRQTLQTRTLLGITAHWIGKPYAVPWWSNREHSGGPFNEQATHLMDLIRYLSGEPETLYAAAVATNGLETTVDVTLRLASGGLGNFLYSCQARDKDILLSIQTTDGVIDLRGWDLELARNTIDDSYPDAESKPIFEKETHAFLEAIARKDATLILSDFASGYQTQTAMDSVKKIIRCLA